MIDKNEGGKVSLSNSGENNSHQDPDFFYKLRLSSATSKSQKNKSEIGELIYAISKTNATNLQQVGATNLILNDRYCLSIIRQADRSFWCALGAAIIGLIFFLVGIVILLQHQQDATQVTLITGLGTAITAFVSGSSFYLYQQAMQHFETFHLCLARTEIVLLENSICTQIKDQTKQDDAYKDIIHNIEDLALLITKNHKAANTTKSKIQSQ